VDVVERAAKLGDGASNLVYVHCSGQTTASGSLPLRGQCAVITDNNHFHHFSLRLGTFHCGPASRGELLQALSTWKKDG